VSVQYRKLDPCSGPHLHLCNLTTFVVSAQNGDAVLVSTFESDEERDSLDRIVAAVDVIAHEEVVGVGALAADAKQLLQIVKLAVNVATHRHGAADGLHIRLLYQNLTSLDNGRSGSVNGNFDFFLQYFFFLFVVVTFSQRARISTSLSALQPTRHSIHLSVS
jgi:hypothetical protein